MNIRSCAKIVMRQIMRRRGIVSGLRHDRGSLFRTRFRLWVSSLFYPHGLRSQSFANDTVKDG